jgi:hypothetical protein
MNSRSPRLFPWIRNVLTVALSCSMIAGADWAASAKAGPASPVGGLSITTDPAEAAIYVDGRLAGSSPLHLPEVAAGDHRVRVVKSGYLENARIVTVAAGKPKSVQITLTRLTETSSAATSQVTSTGGGGGGSKKWLWIGAAGAGAAAAVLLATRNHAPSPGTASVSPSGTGIPGVTNFTFTSQGASDSDGDTLSFSWNFGDGASGTGATAQHVFPNAGTFTVSLTVSDGKKDAKAPDVSVTTRSINGTWSSNLSGTIRTWTLSASGTSVSGTYSSNGAPGTPGSVSGTMTSARGFSGTSMLVGFIPFRFAGDFDSAVSTLTVIANDSGFNNTTLVFNRQ